MNRHLLRSFDWYGAILVLLGSFHLATCVVARSSNEGETAGLYDFSDRIAEASPLADEITLDGSDLTVLVNGKEVNRAWDCETTKGPIGLQSEGGEIHFRKVILTPLGE